MCGIAGYFGKKKIPIEYINNCHNSMEKRGPDFSGHVKFSYSNRNVYLLHNRLKIIDLSNSANQPFSYQGFTIIFNGEIYNFLEIKEKLISKGYSFYTNSDTEVLLKNFVHNGHKSFSEFEGMWSLAIWNDNKKELTLSRDRFGQKPLYFYQSEQGIYFGSQINQILELSRESFQVNEKKIKDNICSGYRVIFKDNETFYKKIKIFPKSNYAVITADNIKSKRYWSLGNEKSLGLQYNKKNYDEIKEKLRSLIEKSVSQCLIADQKISTMLSGGIDSNIILSCIKKLKREDVVTCSVIDNDNRYNEKKNIATSLKNSRFNSIFISEADLSQRNFLEDLEKKNNFLLFTCFDNFILCEFFYTASFIKK